MPEASVDEHDDSARGHHDVRLARKVSAVECKAAAEMMQDRTYEALRRCVAALDGLHARAALRWSQVVRHGLRRYVLCRLAVSRYRTTMSRRVLIDGRQNVHIHPADDRYAHAVAKSEQRLNGVFREREIRRALESGVLAWRHPAEADLSIGDHHDDLTGAPASRRAQEGDGSSPQWGDGM